MADHNGSYVIRLSQREFGYLVQEVLDGLPDEFQAHLQNCVVVVQEWPSDDAVELSGPSSREVLLGLYEGVPLPDRGGEQPLLPDKISIYQRPIELLCESREQIVQEIRRTALHEVGHFFGITDEKLGILGYD